MKPERYRGLVKATIAFGVVMVCLVLVRLQVLAKQRQVVIGAGTVVGWIFVGVGGYEVITGRDEERGGLGWLGVLFVVAVGLVGSVLGFAIAFR